MTDPSEDDLKHTYAELTNEAARLVREGSDPLVTAAALMSLGASIYKTILNEEEFDTMMDTVSALRGQVQRFVMVTPMDAPATLQ